MKIANIDREILGIFWTTWEISMTFSGKMWLMIILKVTKNQSFIVSFHFRVKKKFVYTMSIVSMLIFGH